MTAACKKVDVPNLYKFRYKQNDTLTLPHQYFKNRVYPKPIFELSLAQTSGLVSLFCTIYVNIYRVQNSQLAEACQSNHTVQKQKSVYSVFHLYLFNIRVVIVS